LRQEAAVKDARCARLLRCAIMGHDLNSTCPIPHINKLYKFVLNGTMYTTVAAQLFFYFKSDDSDEIICTLSKPLPQLARECKKYMEKQETRQAKAEKQRKKEEAIAAGQLPPEEKAIPKAAGRKNLSWSFDLKVIVVYAMDKRLRMKTTDGMLLYSDWKKAVPETLKILQDEYPESFQFLGNSHIHRWYENYDAAGKENGCTSQRKEDTEFTCSNHSA